MKKGRIFIITEQQKEQLLEVVGALNNINETAYKIYRGITSELNKTKNIKIIGSFNFVIDNKFNIADFNFENIRIFIDVKDAYRGHGMNTKTI